MKKLSALAVLVVLLALTCAPAFAVTTYGPGQYVTLASGKKNNSWKNAAKVTVDSVSIGGTGKYISWVRDQQKDKQVTGDHYFSTTGEKKMIYLEKKKSIVKSGRKYDLRAKSNKSVPANEAASIEVSDFVP